MARKVTELLEKSFTQETMYKDMDRVSKLLSLSKVPKHQATDRYSGEEVQAQALYQLLEDMDSSYTTPELVVRLDEMEVVQRAITNSSLALGENVQIGARLESLKVGPKDLGVKIGNFNSVPVNVSTTNSAPNIVISDMTHNSFAHTTAKGLGATKTNGPQTNGPKQRSSSQKRSADNDVDSYNPVIRTKMQAKVGKSKFKLPEVEVASI